MRFVNHTQRMPMDRADGRLYAPSRRKQFVLLEWTGKDRIDDDSPFGFCPRNLVMPLSKFASAIAEALPGDLSGEVRRNIHTAVQSVLEKMDLITREELEVQEKVLLRTREKLEALEALITELEQKPAPPSD